MRVERAGGGQLAHPRLGRRVLGELGQRLEAAGGDDLAGGVAVGGDQFEVLQRGEHLGLVATEHRGHAGGLVVAGLGHLRAAGGGQLHGVVGADDAGDRVGGDLADGVAGDDQFRRGQQAAAGQFLMREQRGRDHQGLGDRGVGDLLGGRGGAESGQVEAADLGPAGELVGGSRQFQPRGQHPRGLGTLPGSEQRNHRCRFRHMIKRTL